MNEPGQRTNPFATNPAPEPTASEPPAATPPIRWTWWRRRSAWGVIAALGMGLLVGGLHGHLKTTVEPPDPQAVRDQAGVLAGRLWTDLQKAAHLTGVYGEMFWRASTSDERLLVACKYGELDLMKALLEAGADINYRDHGTDDHLAVEWEGATPLMLAARRGRLDLASYLVDHGAHVDATDAGGDTALHWAIRGSAQPVALYLVQRGADPNRVTRRTNSTAYGLAFGAGMSDLLVEMEQHGGHF